MGLQEPDAMRTAAPADGIEETMTDLERFLQQPQAVNVRILKVITLAAVNFSLERREDGGMDLHLDTMIPPAGIERHTVPFSSDGWEKFEAAIMEAGTGVSIARTIQ
jgi:hypothetical protein